MVKPSIAGASVRSIRKRAEPAELQAWKSENAATSQNLHYDYLHTSVKHAMLQALIAEQHGLCAYTLRPIANAQTNGSNGDAHIEHILPRSLHAEKSVAWDNLLACYPKQTTCRFGAQKKADYDPAQKPFVAPTRMGVEAHFKFRQTGRVEAMSPDAATTENVLDLNNPALVNDRRAKIDAALTRKPTAAAALRRAKELRTPDAHGFLEPYCEAVAQVLEAYANKLNQRANRVAGAKR
jgi:uncharacterized protein (TIGR02646 family)